MEEKLMQKHAYPQFKLHKAAHDRFISDYSDLQKKLAVKGALSFVHIQLKTWLAEWLVAHVSGTDMAFGQWLQREAREQSAPAA